MQQLCGPHLNGQCLAESEVDVGRVREGEEEVLCEGGKIRIRVKRRKDGEDKDEDNEDKDKDNSKEGGG